METTKEFDIIETIDNYNSANIIKNAETKVTKELGELIKNYFRKNDLSNLTANTCEAVVTKVESESFNDTKLMEIIKTLPEEVQSQLIGTKEYIREDVFETLLVNGTLELSTFNNAKETKVTEKLTIKKLKVAK